MKTFTLLAIAGAACVTAFGAASDNASNYASWTNGSTGGTGFGTWDLTNNNDNGTDVFAGYFLGDSTAGAGDINTGGQSFGIYANPGSAFATAIRGINSPLGVNDQFTIQLALNFDNGNKGINLRTGGTNVFGFNVGSGAQINTSFTNVPSTATYDYGGNAVIDITILITSGTTLNYTVSRSSSQGTQGTLFSGSITSVTGSIDNFELYNSGTDDGSAQNNLYFNSMAVSSVPEPAAFAGMIALCILGLGILRRKR